jgi:hypothetical protein
MIRRLERYSSTTVCIITTGYSTDYCDNVQINVPGTVFPYSMHYHSSYIIQYVYSMYVYPGTVTACNHNTVHCMHTYCTVDYRVL